MEMRYCTDLGIPYSIFCGRSQAPGEPYWLEEDRMKALGYLQYKGSFCPNCGTREEDWIDDNGRMINPPRYEAATVKCFGCSEIERMKASIPDKERGVYVVPKRFDPNEEPELIRQERDKKRRDREELEKVLTGQTVF